MKRTLVACFVVAMFGYSLTIAAASGDVLERRKAVMAAHPDGRFLLAFEDELPRIKAAVDDVIRCERAGRAGCIEVAQDALSVAQAAVTFASNAEVSSRVEPVRIMAEAGFRAAALALSNVMRFHQTGRREALSRAELEVSEAEELLLGAAAVAQGVGEAQASGEAPRELPPSPQVQRDVDGFIASQKAQGVRVENVFITSIAPDKLEKDLAHAEARGERGGDETNRWRLVLSYRKAQDSWKLERLAPTSTRRRPRHVQ